MNRTIGKCLLAVAFLAVAEGTVAGKVAVPGGASSSASNITISASSTFYDRKEGMAVLKGGVHVVDRQYQLHAERAFVFNDPVSNTVARIIAFGNVAATNGVQRAYGAKAAYYRKSGMVVLYGDEKTPAIVRDESRSEEREVVGEKIRFWVNSQQVEVLKARISAPVATGGDAIKSLRSH